MVGPRLYFNDFAGARAVFPLDRTICKLGRNSENHVVLNDPSISRFHAEIRAINDHFVLMDLGSKNGTLVNGEFIREWGLTHGDRIQLGSNPSLTLFFATSDLEEAALSSAALSAESPGSKVSSHHLRMLLEVSKALNSSLVLEDVLNRVMEAVMELTGADRGCLMLKDDRGAMQMTVSRNFSADALKDQQYRFSQSVIQRVVETEKSVIVCDSGRNQDFREQKSVIALNLKTIMCVPLRIRRADLRDTPPESNTSFMTIGLIYVDKQTVTQFFSDQDLELFETLAGHAAIAIENARLHQEEIEKLQLEEEMRIASEIQQTLLPSRPPALEHTRFAGINIPCRAIGGDYYDFIPLGPSKVGIVIADVAGKGCSAALLTSMAQGIFLAEASAEKSAAQTVAEVNHFLAQKNPSNKFVTVFYGILDDAGEFRFCNAGHNPPLWVSAEGAVRPLREGGMVLGVFDGAPFEEGVVHCASGDRVVFFTDGVTEAQSVQHEELGEERFREWVVAHRAKCAEAMKEEIIQSVMRFTSGAMQYDDITLVVAEKN